MPERVVVRDEEPAVAAALDNRLRGAGGEGGRVEHPLHRVGRTEFAVEARSAGGLRDEQLLLLVGDVLDRQTHRRYRYVHNQIDLFDIIPTPRNAGADVRLELMIAED